MRIGPTTPLILGAGLIVACSPALGQQLPLGTAFTFQGQLTLAGVPVTGPCDFQCTLWMDPSLSLPGYQVGPTQTVAGVNVNNGVFTIELDFGSDAIVGHARWLDLSVSCPPGTPFTLLTPRQELKPTPHALALPGLWTQQNPTSPNLIGGFCSNEVMPGLTGATIAGGGFNLEPNRVTDDFGTVGGGANNQAGPLVAAGNTGEYATVSGGSGNSALAAHSTIGGGIDNVVDGVLSTIGGGFGNQATAAYATVSGGGRSNPGIPATANRVTDDFGTIGGGGNNRAGDAGGTTADATYPTVSGGGGNRATDGWCTVGGGADNLAGDDLLPPDSAEYATVGGGQVNLATDGWCTVSGGLNNLAGLSPGAPGLAEFATVGGGLSNFATAFESTIGGGVENFATNHAATIAGGEANHADGDHSAIGGGFSNMASVFAATIAGGEINEASGDHSSVGGGYGNQALAAFATVAGGGRTDPLNPASANRVTDDYGAVGGGGNNRAGDAIGTTITAIHATVAGGRANTASGSFSTVPGGSDNTADGDYSFAAGRRAKALHDGAFVLTDSTNADFASTANNQFLIRAAGNVGIDINNPTSKLTVAGTIASTSGGFKFPDGTIQSTAATGGGGGQWTTSGSNIYNNNTGNVGVGTTSPASKLDVAGTAEMDGFKLNGGAAAGYVLTSDASGAGTWQPATGGGGGLTLPYSGSTTSATYAFSVSNSTVGGTAILGQNLQGSGLDGWGVLGTANGPYGTGVFGWALSTSGSPTGVFGFTSAPGGRAVVGLASTSTGVSYGVLGNSTSPDGYGVYGTAPAGGSGAAVRCIGRFHQTDGPFVASPTTTTWTTNKPATVKLEDGTPVKLFAEEAAEVYFNDYGLGQLSHGRARVELDPTFRQTVTIDAEHPMLVFVQVEGDCQGVFVTNKTSDGFDVVELGGGVSDAPFAYRVVCKRKHYEDQRLSTEAEDIEFNTRMLQLVWPELVSDAPMAITPPVNMIDKESN